MTVTEAPGFSSALVAASARLAEAGRKLRRDPRIREVFEGIDLDEGPDGTTISSYLDILPLDGPTVSWLLDGTLSARHWNLEGSIRRDPDGNGQRVVTRFAVRAGDEPQSSASVREPARSPRGGPRNATATKRKGTVDAGTVGNARSRQRAAIIV